MGEAAGQIFAVVAALFRCSQQPSEAADVVIRSQGCSACCHKEKIINCLFSYWHSVWRKLQHTQRRALVFSKEPQSDPLLLYLLCMKNPSAARVSIVRIPGRAAWNHVAACCLCTAALISFSPY